MRFIETVFEKLRRHPKRIVFPEGAEERIILAASRLAEMQLVAPILLGERDGVLRKARELGVDPSRFMILEPERSADFLPFCDEIRSLARYRRLGAQDAADLMRNPSYYAAMMLQRNRADGLLGGASVTSSALLRPLFQLIKPLPGVRSVSGAMVMEVADRRFGHDGVLFLADCAVIPDPSVDQLASIAVETGKLCAQLTGERPRVALLSFSTRGSAKTPATEKVVAATALARQRAEAEAIEMEIDGELQADAAILPEAAQFKNVGGLVAGRANVLIFPDLNSANIAGKLLDAVAGAESYGQILLGLSKPAAEVSRSASVDEIVGVAAITGLQAVAYGRLYGEADEG